MVAAVTDLVRLGFFSSIYPMFKLKNIRECICLFAVLCTILRLSVAEDQEFMEEFLKREYTLANPYHGLGFSSSSPWDLTGTAVVTPDHVRLTADQPGRQGAVWSRIPLQLRDWELKVHFKIHGQAKKNLNGDGLAFWLTKERMQNGPVFGSRNEFTGLGIFVDTYPNADKKHDRVFPYVSVMLGNGTLSYDHDSDGRPTELGGCSAMVRNARHDTFLLIRYTKNRLTVMVDVDGKQIWKDCVDIIGLRMPIGYYLGASSATGDLADNHDLISMKLYQLTVERSPEEHLLIPRVDSMEQFNVEIQEEGMSGVQLFFTLLFTILGLGVLAVVGVIVYGRWKENKRKRFY
ncbi:VIP36-like protein isoform X2 [Dunckerocampus dactyliophorus]|uniref:VIP36-like protein isoform X2 n=1 Tax=Dunckerocampus dactyliophorus TaxID=161453 RepID=UPI0024067368|nr:VIP36-like protein isoform X2 [Dunckerocampus dactyliophorus]